MTARRWILVLLVLALAGAGYGGWWWSQNHLQPIPLAPDEALFEKPQPDFGQDGAVLVALLPQGAKLHAFLLGQVGEPLLLKGREGWVGMLAESLWGSANQRHWRLRLRPGVKLHDGGTLDATWALDALRHLPEGPFSVGAGAEGRVVDGLTLDLDFTEPVDLPGHLSRDRALLLSGMGPRAVGTGPFRFLTDGRDTRLARFDEYRHGKAGIAGLVTPEGPELFEGHRWTQDMLARRYDWSCFPGQVDPADMARVRELPMDNLRMQDGSVWFLSRRLRRLHPVAADWSRTRLFGIWRADVELPYDPR